MVDGLAVIPDPRRSLSPIHQVMDTRRVTILQ